VRDWCLVSAFVSLLIFLMLQVKVKMIVQTYLRPLICWGVRKSEGVTKHKSREQKHTSHERQGDKESLKACTRLKSCGSLYMCPRAPYYRETKGLLHSEITLESKEYSQCEHVQECLLHPVTCEANFIHLPGL
jgi:hypothetical protein